MMKWSVFSGTILTALCLAYAQSPNPDTSLVSDTMAAQDPLPALQQEPKLISFVNADYPDSLVKKGIAGVVSLELLISDSGKVDSVAVIKGLDPVLDSSAVKAARAFTFSPAVADSQNVAVIIQYDYRFSIEEVADKIEKFVNYKGKLLERGTRNPIGDALVIVHFLDTANIQGIPVAFSQYIDKIATFGTQKKDGSALVIITDSTGSFEFTSLPACSISVRIQAVGYEAFVDREVLRSSELTEVLYRLQRTSYNEYQTVVYGTVEKKEVARRTLTLMEVRKVPGFGGDAVKVVQALPGVARPTFGSGEVVVRGAPTWDSKFYLDGVEIPSLYHFGLKSTYNSEALEDIDFYPGGWGTRYGGAIGGVIEIKGRKAKTDRIHGYVDASFMDASFMVEGPIHKDVSILASARRSFIGDIIGFAVNNFSDLSIAIAPTYWDYLLRTDWKISANSHTYLTLFGSKDATKMVVPEVRGGSKAIDNAVNEANFSSGFHMGILGWDWKPLQKLANDLRYSFVYRKDMISAFGFFKEDVTYKIHTLRNASTYSFSDNLKLIAAADIEWAPGIDFTISQPLGGGGVAIDTFNNMEFGVIGAYLNCEWKPFDKLQVIPGIRYDYYPELSYVGSIVPEYWNYDASLHKGYSGEPSARLTARYEVVKNHTLKGAIGNYNQSPKPVGQTTVERWGDPHMPSTEAAHYVLGYEWQATDLINLDVQGYLNNQWRIPRYRDVDELKVNPDITPMIGDQKGRMRGLEVMLRHNQGQHFFGWIAYSLSRSERYNRMTSTWDLYEKDQTHNVVVVGNFKLPKNWETGFKLQYTTGDPETPDTGSYNDLNNHHFRSEKGVKNSERLDPTFQIDLRVDKKFIFDKWVLSTYLDIFNASYFFYKSPQMYIYNYDPYSQITHKSDRIAVSQYIFPSIGLKAEF